MAVIETVVTVGVVAGLVEAIKRAANIPSHVVPLLSIGVGVVLGGLYTLTGDTLLLDGIFNGLLAGLAASGTYDLVTKTGR